MYFTKFHEDAIVRYTELEDDYDARSKLYEEVIGPVLSEMVDKIVATYRFTTLPNITDLKDECKVWLSTILSKYDPSKGTKAFSYFSVVTKNWFIQKTKNRSRNLALESSYDDIPEWVHREILVIKENPYEQELEAREFFDGLKEEVETWDAGHRSNLLGENDLKVVKAVKILLEHFEEIEIYNKKAIYVNLRELTGLNTKQITRSLKKLRSRYDGYKQSWLRGEI